MKIWDEYAFVATDYTDLKNRRKIDKMIVGLRKNQKYKAFLYTLCVLCMLSIIVVGMSIPLLSLLSMEFIANIDFKLCVVLVLSLLVLCIVIISYKHHIRKKRNKVVEANINVAKTFMLPPHYGKLSMGLYIFVAYRVEDINTYRFTCKVRDRC